MHVYEFGAAFVTRTSFGCRVKCHLCYLHCRPSTYPIKKEIQIQNGLHVKRKRERERERERERKRNMCDCTVNVVWIFGVASLHISSHIHCRLGTKIVKCQKLVGCMCRCVSVTARARSRTKETTIRIYVIHFFETN